MRGNPVLFYSGGCKFCRWVVRVIIPRLDPTGKLDIIPLRHPWADAYFPGEMSLEYRVKGWWLYYQGDLEMGNPAFLLNVVRNWHWPWLIEGTLIRLDRWVKDHRWLLSRWVDDGPAILKTGHTRIELETHGKSL